MTIHVVRPALHPTRLFRSALLLASLGATAAACANIQAQATPASSAPAITSAQQAPLTPEQQGDEALALKHFQAAVEDYRQVPQPTARTWNKMGIANQELGSMDEAKRSYQHSLKLQPKDADVLNNLGTIQYALQQYQSAERTYRKALKINPNSAIVYRNLGTDLMAQSQFQKGWDLYQQALKLDPDSFTRENQFRIGEPAPAHERGAMNYFLARSYVRAGLPDRAIECLRLAIDEGFTDRKRVNNDIEFALLHNYAPYQALLAEESTP